MLAFVPRGYVPLAAAVKQIVDALTAENNAGFKECQKRLMDALSPRDALQKPVNSVLLLTDPAKEFSLDDLTDDQMIHVRGMTFHSRQTQNIKQRIHDAIQQDLGEGDTQVMAVQWNGERVAVPDSAWRTHAGDLALTEGPIRWFYSGSAALQEGTPFVKHTDVKRWLEMLKDTGASGLEVSSKQISDPITSNAAPPTSIGKRHITVRTAMPPDAARMWMSKAARAAQDAGEAFNRTDAVALCQTRLNCTRVVARAAYTARPANLKQPRGKPAKPSHNRANATSIIGVKRQTQLG